MTRPRSHVSRIRMVAWVMALCVAVAQCMPVWALSPGNAPSPLPSRLNLSSTHKTVTAPQSLSSPVTILNGGQSQAVTAGMSLTPAQLVAVLQVLSTGTQSLVLGTNGGAAGGSMVLQSSQNLSYIKVPHGVAVVGDFSNGSALAVGGSFNNGGTFYAVSSNPAVSNAVVSAQNITNGAGGLITTVLPSSGLSNFANALPNLSLSLIATNLLRNAGTISSAKDLNLVAGSQIINSGTAGAQAVLSAAGNINIGTQLLSNSGLVQSSNANVVIVQQAARNGELAALAAQLGPQQGAFATLSDLHDLLVDNRGGVIEALNGSIVVDHGDAQTATAVAIGGGDLLSQYVNVNAGVGHLNIDVANLTGPLSVKAGTANVGETVGTLNLANVNTTGDPIFWSLNTLTVGAGNVTPITNLGDSITFLSAGNIDFGSTTVSTALTSGSKGFNITAVAGANLSPSPPNPANGLPAGQTVKVLGAGNGGEIDCAGCRIDASSSVQGQPGGNILLVAYGNGTGTGKINLHNTGVTTTVSSLLTNAGPDSGHLGGQAGSVTLIAPGHIRLDKVTMFGTTGIPKLTVTTAQPTGTLTATAGGLGVPDKVTSGLKPSKTISSTGVIFVGDSVLDGAGSIALAAGDTITVDTTATINGSPGPFVPGTAGGTINLTAKTVTLNGTVKANGELAFGEPGLAGGKGGTIKITANGGNISDNGNAGRIEATGADGVAGSAGQKGGAGGLGGVITLAGNALLLSNTLVLISGGSGGDNTGIKAAPGKAGGAGGAGGSGGTLSVTAFTGPVDVEGINASGGSSAGGGGTGGDATSSTAKPGSGGAGGAGGRGGKVTLTSLQDDINVATLFTVGGAPGTGGVGGKGGDGVTGGKGGTGGVGGAGGSGGTVILRAGIGHNVVVSTTLGTSGAQGASGGKGGDGGAGSGLRGGDGGTGGNGGNGGKGGNITLQGGLTAPPPILYLGAVGGLPGQGGNGGPSNGNLPPGAKGNSGSKGGTTGTNGKLTLISDASDDQSEDAAPYKRTGRSAGKHRSATRATAVSGHPQDGQEILKPVVFVEPQLSLSNRLIPASNVLLSAAKHDLEAEAGAVHVHVARGASAFVVNNGRDVTVLSLHEQASGDVNVLAGGERITLRMGEQVVITSSASDLVDINPTAGITVRNEKERKLADGVRAITCEFSLASAISNLHALRRLAHSPDRHDRAVFTKFLKNAAVLQTMTAGKGPYKAYQPTVRGGQAI